MALKTFGQTIITVLDPQLEKGGKLQKDFTTYRIDTHTDLEEFGGLEFSVRRRSVTKEGVLFFNSAVPVFFVY